MRSHAILVPLLLASQLTAQRASAPPTGADSAAYLALVARMRTGDTTVDVTTIRLLYSRLGPISGRPDAKALFARARIETDVDARRAIVDSVRNAYYGHVNVHRDVVALLREAGDTVAADEAATIWRAFIASIGSSDGLTEATAMLVVSVAEEYAFLRAKGVDLQVQSLVPGKAGGTFDFMEGTEKATGKPVAYYFRLNWWPN